ncbi:hypothetical protein CERZMDRAFT_94824 [Cercospora zeae-maydis SCOH1-5]|uniref:Glucose-methanol-choline oxidoreductase N-terminal domain-containing protein n=1 Tax=Cercospora zeae-maydis SCOH1-5 TaxID=717836 RepID=A0A6A6FQ41_9PEZI|nr:hypothetical protein CERZMDRAFT_94824 [Cercospora zeae-maydis SCOH1-5]
MLSDLGLQMPDRRIVTAAPAHSTFQRFSDQCILLLEAGPSAPGDPEIEVPGLRGSIAGGPLDRNLTTVPQRHAHDRNVPQARGKVLGGSSAMHQLIWNRAARAEYDALEQLGNPNWNWQSMLQYMRRSEEARSDAEGMSDILFHDGHAGPLGYPSLAPDLFGRDFFGLTGILMHPFSRGNVHITGPSMNATPALDPHYLEAAHDLHTLVEAVRLMRRIAATEPLASTWDQEYLPGGQVSMKVMMIWKDMFGRQRFTLWHTMGTCSMLPYADGGVVDPELKVYGTSNLRIADASVIPVIISAHPQSLVYAIAEKAADIILSIHGA